MKDGILEVKHFLSALVFRSSPRIMADMETNAPGKELSKVLLIGDSIRMSYQPLVQKLLAGKATVVGPAENCQFSLYTLSALPRWLAELGRPDIVHWNNGLHDSGHNPRRNPVQIPVGMYRANLKFILDAFHAVTPKPRVIWATMTPAHPQRPFRTDAWSWRNEEIDEYNQAAVELMNEHAIPINDLHALIRANPDQSLSEDKLHLSEAGKEICARAVTKAITTFLPGGL